MTPEFVSESLAHNRLQAERAFLIDIARMAVLASKLEVRCLRLRSGDMISADRVEAY